MIGRIGIFSISLLFFIFLSYFFSLDVSVAVVLTFVRTDGTLVFIHWSRHHDHQNILTTLWEWFVSIISISISVSSFLWQLVWVWIMQPLHMIIAWPKNTPELKADRSHLRDYSTHRQTPWTKKGHNLNNSKGDYEIDRNLATVLLWPPCFIRVSRL